MSILFVTYITFEVPSNLVLKKFTPSRWIAFITVSWGIVATLTGLVESYAGLLACRVILGALEAGLFPGMNLYLTFFYTKNELAMRVGYLFVSAAIAGALGGLLAFGIGHMDGIQGMSGWRVSSHEKALQERILNKNTVDHDNRGNSYCVAWNCYLLPHAKRPRNGLFPGRGREETDGRPSWARLWQHDECAAVQQAGYDESLQGLEGVDVLCISVRC